MSVPNDTAPRSGFAAGEGQARGKKAQRGKLRIYFGSSAGVGKTFAMLVAARKLRSEAVDVVVGVVETHGRSETAAQLEGLGVLPPKACLIGARCSPTSTSMARWRGIRR
jgi:two-component system sensor histidine kinase KdpD